MRNPDAEITALAKQGIELDETTEANYRAEVDRINAEPKPKPTAALDAPAPAPRKKARKRT